MKQWVEVSFPHGLGDCVYFASQIAIYRQHGIGVRVHCNPDKAILFRAVGAEVVHDKPDAPTVSYFDSPGMRHGGSNGHGEEGGFHLADINKAGHNFSRAPMPNIGAPKDLWREFVDVRPDIFRLIEPTVWREIERFTRHLPRPLILVHTMGNTFSDTKNLPRDLTEQLYRELLNQTDGTLILLDWDNRVPKLASHRVRHLLDDWRRVSVEELIALQAVSDLLIGIDSGPFHLTRLTGIPALGVFPHPAHHPVKYCLPCATQASVVPKGTSSWIDRLARISYSLMEEDSITGECVAKHAVRMLAEPRYLSRHNRAHDSLLQHWVRDRCKTEGGGSLSARVDRDRGFDLLLAEARRRFATPTMVETGCVRAHDDWAGAGSSTLVLGLYCQATGGSLTSIDINPRNLEVAKQETRGLDAISFCQGDSNTVLRESNQQIDVLLLDSLDTEAANHREHCQSEVEAAMSRLHRTSLIVIDDTVYESGRYKGKGAFAVPWLLDRGWGVMHSGYQTILSRAGASIRLGPVQQQSQTASSASPVPKRRFFVCSYGGCGSKLLTEQLQKYGQSFHIHSRTPPRRLTRVRGEHFTEMPLPEDDGCGNRVIFLYSRPQYSLMCDASYGDVHWRNIEVPRHARYNIPHRREDYLELDDDPVNYLEFFSNYTNGEARSYDVIAIDFHRLWDHLPQVFELLDLPSTDIASFPARGPDPAGVKLDTWPPIFEEINRCIDAMPPVLLIPGTAHSSSFGSELSAHEHHAR